MKRILVPCDFSRTAQSAYTFALDIAKKTGAEVFVLKVIDLPFAYEPAFPEMHAYYDPKLEEELKAQARQSFAKMKGEHTRQEDIAFLVDRGPVTGVIRKQIDELKIDLVVMGTHGASGFVENLIGSNTEKIVRLSPVPVIAVRAAVNLASIGKIVVATTLDRNESAFIEKVKELQAFFGAKLHLLVVNTPYNLKRTAEEKSEMEEFATLHKLKDYTLHTRDDFSEAQGVLGFARDIGADMIAMGTHGRRGLAHLFMGSVAEDVVNKGSCPIWTFPLRRNTGKQG